ncbi:hypothetical protein N2152v2_003158 [Parachlorella kessleri]
MVMAATNTSGLQASHRSSQKARFAQTTLKEAVLSPPPPPEQAAADDYATLGQLALYTIGSEIRDTDKESASHACTPQLASFLEHALRGIEQETHPSPSAPLLVITIISRLRFGGADAAARQPFQSLYQRAATMLMEAADQAGWYKIQDASVMSAKEVLEYFAAAAEMDFPATVYKGCGFGHLLTHHLKKGSFSPQQLVRLLESWAKLRADSRYNPCVLNFRILTQVLVSVAPSLTRQELLRVVASCRSFEWPVYSSMALLEGVCNVTVQRVATGELALTAGQSVIETAADTAGHFRPVLRGQLLAKVGPLPQLPNSPKHALPKDPAGAGGQVAAPAEERRAAPAGSIVPGPGRWAGAGMLQGLAACLPAVLLLALPALPKLPMAGVLSLMLLVSLSAGHRV